VSRLRARIGAARAAVRAEDGYIMVIAMLLIVIGLAAGAAAITEALHSRSSADRAQRSHRALQAANAGIQTELYRANQVDLSSLKLSGGLNLPAILSQLLLCPVPQLNASGQVSGLAFVAQAAVGKPCPTNTTSNTPKPMGDKEPVGHHDSFEVQFVPGTNNVGDFVELVPKIVASGVDDPGSGATMSRRIEAILAPVMPWRTLEAAHNLEIDVPGTALLAGATIFNGTAAAGNNFTLKGLGALFDTFTAANASLSGGLTEPSAIDFCGGGYPPPQNVNVVLSAGAINHVTSGCGSLVNRPTIQVSSSKPPCPSSCAGLTGYDPANDEIKITNGASISFAPGDYVFCGFSSNGSVSVNPSWPPSAGLGAVRIFIDPGRCGTTPYNKGNFTATQGINNALAATHPSQAQIYLVGNGTNDATSVTLTGNGLGQAAFVYAPTSRVTVTSSVAGLTGGTLAGAFIGYDVTASGAVISQDAGLLNYPLSTTLGPFHVQQYIECTPQYPLPSPDPTAGC
jgi:hypothetical protein